MRIYHGKAGCHKGKLCNVVKGLEEDEGCEWERLR